MFNRKTRIKNITELFHGLVKAHILIWNF